LPQKILCKGPLKYKAKGEKKLKRKISLLLTVVLITLSFISGVSASEKISAVTAYINRGLAIQVNGVKIEPKDNDGSRIYPIVYDGRTYVLASAVAEALGAAVKYDSSGDGTLIISSSSGTAAGVPTKEGGSSNAGMPTKEGTSTGVPQTGGAAASTNSGSINSPVPMNQRFTWTDTYNYGGLSYSGTYSVTIKGVQPISRDAIANLGFQRPQDDSRTEYVMVDMLWEVKDGKLISAEADYPYKFLSTFEPNIFGVITPSGSRVIGATDYGFEGSLDRKISEVTGFKQLSVGMSDSYSAEGKVLLQIMKNEENYMVFLKSGESDYDKSKIHFSLK
jgi:hypothetical protein